MSQYADVAPEKKRGGSRVKLTNLICSFKTQMLCFTLQKV